MTTNIKIPFGYKDNFLYFADITEISLAIKIYQIFTRARPNREQYKIGNHYIYRVYRGSTVSLSIPDIRPFDSSVNSKIRELQNGKIHFGHFKDFFEQKKLNKTLEEWYESNKLRWELKPW